MVVVKDAIDLTGRGGAELSVRRGPERRGKFDATCFLRPCISVDLSLALHIHCAYWNKLPHHINNA